MYKPGVATACCLPRNVIVDTFRVILLYFSRCHLEIYPNLLRNRFGLLPVIAINFDFNLIS
jgi:hypothetical protein